MGQTSFHSCECDFLEPNINPSRNLNAIHRQNGIGEVAGKLKRIGDSLQSQYMFSNILYDLVREYGIENTVNMLLTGINSALILQALLS